MATIADISNNFIKHVKFLLSPFIIPFKDLNKQVIMTTLYDCLHNTFQFLKDDELNKKTNPNPLKPTL